jgi:predicted MFS family arabinose efflux permease
VSEAAPWRRYTPRQRRQFLLVLFLIGTCNFVDRNVIGVLLEQIKAEFQASDTVLGLLSGLSFALFYATLGIPVARWADRGDRKRVIAVSVSIWSVMTVLCGFASSFWQLLVARFGVGAGEAGAVPPAQSLIADYYSPTERARAIGIFMMSGSAGYALGLILGGWIAQHYGWRAVFVFFGVLGLALAPLAHFKLNEPRRDAPPVPSSSESESGIAACRALFAKPAYRLLVAGIVVYYVMAYGAFVFIVSHMIRAHGLSVAQAGALVGVISAAAAIVGSYGGGALADRLAARDITWLPRFAGWAMIAAIPFYEVALGASTLHAMVPALVLAVIVHSAVVPPAFSAVHAVCGSKRRALAVAVVFFFANLIGLGLGPILSGALSDAFGAVYGSADGLRYALMVMMSVLLPAGWLMLRAARTFSSGAED